jgi:HSP20 family protein
MDLDNNFHDASRSFASELKETPTSFELACELPGFTKNNVEISCFKNVLTVKAEYSVDRSSDGEINDENIRMHWSERSYGRIERSFRLPKETVQSSDISARLEDGLLSITLPKTKTKNTEPHVIKIK